MGEIRRHSVCVRVFTIESWAANFKMVVGGFTAIEKAVTLIGATCRGE
jgi:hypothetical protein